MESIYVQHLLASHVLLQKVQLRLNEREYIHYLNIHTFVNESYSLIVNYFPEKIIKNLLQLEN